MLAKRFFVIVILLGTGSQVAADLYLASLPSIAHYFHTNSTAAQLTVSIYMYGVCFSQCIYGPLSDGIGRRIPILLGLSICILGTLICSFASSINILVIGRLLQGLGAGAGLTLSRAIMRDLFAGEKIARYSSYFAIFSIAIMAGAPLIGSYILEFLSWQYNFIFLGIYFFLVLTLIFFVLTETNIHLHPENLRWPVIKKNAKTLLTSVHFLGYSFCGAFAYGGILAWLTTGPILLQKSMGLTPIQYGWVTFFVAFGNAIGGFTNGRIVMNYGINRMIFVSSILMLTASILLCLFVYLDILTVKSVALPAMLYLFSCGFIFANSVAGALNYFPKISGFASSIYGTLQILGGAIYSTIISYSPETTQLPLGIAFLSIGIGIMISLRFAVKHQSNSYF